MPKFASLLALFLAAAPHILCSILPRKQPRNYIVDGGFESITTQRPRGQQPWTAGNWTFIKYAEPKYDAPQTCDPSAPVNCPYEGNSDVSFSAFRGPWKGVISQQISGLRGGPFNMSFAYGIGSHPLAVNCTWTTTLESQVLDDWVITTDSPTSFDWMMRSFQFNPLVASGALNISWYCPQFRDDPENNDYGAQFYLDDISIVKST